jgi:hypothetical protein
MMRAADASGVSFSAAEPSARAPGIDLLAVHQVGWAVLNRVGIIRADKT